VPESPPWRGVYSLSPRRPIHYFRRAAPGIGCSHWVLRSLSLRCWLRSRSMSSSRGDWQLRRSLRSGNFVARFATARAGPSRPSTASTTTVAPRSTPTDPCGQDPCRIPSTSPAAIGGPFAPSTVHLTRAGDFTETRLPPGSRRRAERHGAGVGTRRYAPDRQARGEQARAATVTIVVPTTARRTPGHTPGRRADLSRWRPHPRFDVPGRGRRRRIRSSSSQRAHTRGRLDRP